MLLDVSNNVAPEVILPVAPVPKFPLKSTPDNVWSTLFTEENTALPVICKSNKYNL